MFVNKKHKTNKQLIASYMDSSPIHQAFVMEALFKYADQINENQDNFRERMKHSLINPEVWIAAAKDVGIVFPK